MQISSVEFLLSTGNCKISDFLEENLKWGLEIKFFPRSTIKVLATLLILLDYALEFVRLYATQKFLNTTIISVYSLIIVKTYAVFGGTFDG